MGLIRITADMSESERIAAYNSNMQYLEKEVPLNALPVGITLIFYTAEADPNEIYGGTWERTAKGRAIVGVDEDDEDFATAGLTLGEKKHTSTVAEMPSHIHQGIYWLGSEAGNISLNAGGQNPGYSLTNWTGSTVPETYPVIYTGPSGSNQPHNNIQPSETFYIWTRVA